MLIYLCIKTWNNSIKLFFIVDSIFIIIWTIIVLWFFEITQKLITWIVNRQEDIQYDLELLRSGNLSDLQIVSTKIDLIANITKINEWSVTILNHVNNMASFMLTSIGYLLLNLTKYIYLKIK